VLWPGRQHGASAQGLAEDVIVWPGSWTGAVALLGPGGPAPDESGVVPQEREGQGDQLGSFLEGPAPGCVLGGD